MRSSVFGGPKNARPKLGFPIKQIPDFSLLKMKRLLSLWQGFFSANEGGGHPMYIFMKQKEMINKGKIHVFVITISRTRLYRFQPVQINLSPIKNQFFIAARMNEYRWFESVLKLTTIALGIKGPQEIMCTSGCISGYASGSNSSKSDFGLVIFEWSHEDDDEEFWVWLPVVLPATVALPVYAVDTGWDDNDIDDHSDRRLLIG